MLFAQQGETFSVVDFTEKPFDTAARDERYRIIDGKEYGKTPAVIDGVMIGMRKVTLSKDGYIANSFDVEIKEGKTTEKSVTLKKFITSGDGQASQNGNAVIDGHEYVDLGLPSGLKWATCNVDATTPEEYGGYYAWGETEEKENYCWNTYKWCNDSLSTLTKYCTDDSYGIIVDNKTILDPEDDVAHVKWGGCEAVSAADDTDISKADILSQREKEIVVCIAKGMSNKEVADALNLSVHTVTTHRRNISSKLQIHSPAGITIYAIVNKLLDLHEI